LDGNGLVREETGNRINLFVVLLKCFSLNFCLTVPTKLQIQIIYFPKTKDNNLLFKKSFILNLNILHINFLNKDMIINDSVLPKALLSNGV